MTEPPKVVGLRGQPIADGRSADPEVVKKLEWLLDAARSGEVTGVLCVWGFFDGAAGCGSAGYVTYTMVGRSEQAKASAINVLLDK